jgi:transcription-repair coupling factor (superfamily II helicase)
LTPPAESLSDDSRKRLDVLAAHQELGAGFQIASYDLELRGAGNLLGGEQSGHAAAVGLELYTEMLEDAIQTLRGEPVADRIDTEIKLPVAALIPVSYIQSEPQRLQMYKKLFACETEAELRGLKQEIQDRYGALPAPTTLLFKVARLKQQLKSLGALRVTAGKGVCEIKFAPLGDKMIDTILGTISRQPGRYKLAPDHRLLLYLDIPVNPSVEDQENLIGELSRLVAPLVASVPS